MIMAMLLPAWQGVRQRISDALIHSSRSLDDCRLLAVSKTFPAEAIVSLYALGQREFGENYVQELCSKASTLANYPDLIWHFIGPLQSNKTRQVAEIAHWVHSVDRLKIAERLSAQRPAHLPELQICLQVNVSGEESKSGMTPEELPELARAVAKLPRLRLRGLMCIPEPTEDQAILAARFGLLHKLFNELNACGLGLDTLSMGMSADLETAISAGSTIVRVGSAIFGARNYS